MGNSHAACSKKKSLGRQLSYLAPATMKPARIVRCLFVGFTMHTHTHTHFLHILYYNLEGTLPVYMISDPTRIFFLPVAG